MLKIPYTPFHLRPPVAVVGQRHNNMVVRLRKSSTMAAESLCAFLIRLKNRLVFIRCPSLQPRKQRRAKIEAYLGIVINDINDAFFVIEDAEAVFGA